jgi:hypothetical protein
VRTLTEEKEEIEKKTFYQKVEAVYVSCPSNFIKIVLGELNAKVRREEIYLGLIGRHCIHLNTNSNGQRIVNFAAAKIWRYPQSVCHTKESINKHGDPQMENNNNKIDHILIDKRNVSSILYVKSCRGASSNSEHFLVRGTYGCKIAYSKH